MGRMITVREVSEDDWELMRDVRLAALAEAPYAFGSTYVRETAFTEERWRGRINERSVTFFALSGPESGAGEPVGLGGVFVDGDQPELVGMWVRPGARGLRVGEALVEAAAAWARGRGYLNLSLWVTAGNAPAVRLYERCGFTATGESQPLPSDPSVPEIRMNRAL